jgi:8-oxo-dGTP pyrophosphatase MutT (NUDIX family)
LDESFLVCLGLSCSLNNQFYKTLANPEYYMKRVHVDSESLKDYSDHPKVKSCGAVIFHKFDDEIKYLIIKTHEKFGNSWDFPKGAMEESETELQTAIREVYEETGLSIDLIGDFRFEMHYLVKRGEILKTSIYFLGESSDSDVKVDPMEVEAYEWLEYEKALSKLTYEQSQNVLKKAHELVLERK